MKINIPKIIQPLDLAGYSSALAGQALQVWVNPPVEMRRRYGLIVQQIIKLPTGIPPERKGTAEGLTVHRAGDTEILAEKNKKQIEKLSQEVGRLRKEQEEWLAEIWSQGAEETRFTAEEIMEFRSQAEQTDPRLFNWLVAATLKMILEHVGAVKKT
jgi:hypothetical protein